MNEAPIRSLLDKLLSASVVRWSRRFDCRVIDGIDNAVGIERSDTQKAVGSRN